MTPPLWAERGGGVRRMACWQEVSWWGQRSAGVQSQCRQRDQQGGKEEGYQCGPGAPVPRRRGCVGE